MAVTKLAYLVVVYYHNTSIVRGNTCFTYHMRYSLGMNGSGRDMGGDCVGLRDCMRHHGAIPSTRVQC